MPGSPNQALDDLLSEAEAYAERLLEDDTLPFEVQLAIAVPLDPAESPASLPVVLTPAEYTGLMEWVKRRIMAGYSMGYACALDHAADVKARAIAGARGRKVRK